MNFSLAPDGHTVIRRLEDGTVEEKKFTSHAEARHFVERANNVTHVEKHRPPSGRRRRSGTVLSMAEQVALRDEALKRFKNL